MPEIIAKLENIGLSYKNGTPLFKQVNFSLEKGSFHFLTGVSGSGKSSLLKLLYLGLMPTRGKLTLFNQNIADLKPQNFPTFRQRIGIVFQEFNLLNHLSVLDNVALPLFVRGYDRKRSRIQATELLDWVGLKDTLATYPETLSGGQKQRVAIARAIITKPDLLLADEPTGNVDDGMAIKLLYLFEELNKLGTTLLLASHNQSLLERFPHPILRIQDQKIDSSSALQE